MVLEGIEPGLRECHDAQPGRLRVDFVYPGAHPRPIALEVTSIVDGPYRAGVRASDAAIRRLSVLAEEEGWGAWLVAVRAIENVRALEPEIAKVIRDAQPIRERLLASNGWIRPNYYTADDLSSLPTARRRREFVAEHERLKTMGLEEVKPVRAKKEHVVAVLPLSGVRAIGSFSTELEGALSDNEAKLGEVGDLERHLAVLVERFDALSDPTLTPLPALPPTIDCLWVVHRWLDEDDRHTTWLGRRNATGWKVHVRGD